MTPPALHTQVLTSAAVARVAPFALFIGFLALGDVVAWIAPASVTTATANWLSVARGIAVGVVFALYFRHYAELRGIENISARRWSLGTMVGLAVFVAWITLDRPAFRMGGAAQGFVPLHQDGTLDLLLVALRLLGLVVVVPMMEEIFWRSFLMRWLTHSAFLDVQPRQVTPAAFLITAALFALAHDLWLAGLVAGLAYNWVYMRSGALWVAIGAHALTNAALAAYILATGAWHLW